MIINGWYILALIAVLYAFASVAILLFLRGAKTQEADQHHDWIESLNKEKTK